MRAVSGQKVAVLPQGFRYVGPPTIESIEPSSGPVEGGIQITIRGTNFETRGEEGIYARVGPRPIEDVEIIDANTLKGTLPPGNPGLFDIAVRTPFGYAKLPDAFLYKEPAGPLFSRGDCNGDASTNIADAIALLEILFSGRPEPICLEACNANDDDKINIADVVATLMYLFAGAGDLPPPFPDCGSDPTPSTSCQGDQLGCKEQIGR